MTDRAQRIREALAYLPTDPHKTERPDILLLIREVLQDALDRAAIQKDISERDA